MPNRILVTPTIMSPAFGQPEVRDFVNDFIAEFTLTDAKPAALSRALVLATAEGQKEALALIKEGKYGATGLNDADLVARTAADIGVRALNGELPADPKLVLNKHGVTTKENVDKYYRKDAVF